jgi:hypothetical protein
MSSLDNFKNLRKKVYSKDCILPGGIMLKTMATIRRKSLNRTLAAEILISLVEGLSRLLTEQCDFVSMILSKDFDYHTE